MTWDIYMYCYSCIFVKRRKIIKNKLIQVKAINIKGTQMVSKSYTILNFNCSNKTKVVSALAGTLWN